MSNPLISIVTVSYNAASTIEQTILSVLNQTYPNIEYIIIDGGSTDGTLEIIKKYAHKLSYWVSEPDEGIYDAMNKGIAHAQGDLVGIINSDDWYEDIIEKVVSSYQKRPEPECLFHGNIRFYSSNSFIVSKPCLNLAQLYRGTILFHPTLFVPRKVYDRIGGFQPHYRIAADYDFILRCYQANYRFVYLNEVIANMRTDGESNTHQLEGYQEVLQIALKAGLPRYKVYRSFIYKYIIGSTVRLKKKLEMLKK